MYMQAGLLSAVVAICATGPLLAAEPMKADAAVQQQQPLERVNAGQVKRTKVVSARFPELALRHGMFECFVDLRFTVLPDGSTADIKVAHSEPVPLFALFEESAIRAVQQWRYEPVMRDGRPVAQSMEIRLRFDGRQAAYPVTYDDPIDPVSAASMESVLRRDLDETLSNGVLSAISPIGIAIGIVRDGERRVFTFGKAQPDAIFEIGAITKTFTGLLLALAIEQEKVKIDTPLRELLPPGTVAKPANGSEITLLDLVTQHSGLPPMPGNFQPKDPSDPYADYDSTQLYQFLREHGVAKPARPAFLDSNPGFALLGQALANRAKADYPALLERSVLDPLGMRDTVSTLDADQQRRVIRGHDPARRAAHAWDLSAAFSGASGLRSTASDMLRYLEANLRQRTADLVATPDARMLAAALRRSQTLQADAPDALKIAYGWVYDAATETYQHDGATGGYSSFAFFSPTRGYAGIVLANLTLSRRGNFAATVGKHIGARFAGEKPVSLRGW
jgi:serine-type D-Ala-D-Ala carboxypeptidase/endopeptidase